MFKRTAARKSQEAKGAMEQEAERLEALLARSKLPKIGGGSVSLPKIGGRKLLEVRQLRGFD